jgi:SNF2-related domain
MPTCLAGDERADLACICRHTVHDHGQARVQFHVLLTTYEMVVAEATELRRIQWQTLVVDEAHRLRRSTSRLELACCLVRTTETFVPDIGQSLCCCASTMLGLMHDCRLFVELASIESVARVALSGTPLQVSPVSDVPRLAFCLLLCRPSSPDK